MASFERSPGDDHDERRRVEVGTGDELDVSTRLGIAEGLVLGGLEVFVVRDGLEADKEDVRYLDVRRSRARIIENHASVTYAPS